MSYKIIGHRGDKTAYIENTLAGFQSVLEMEGVDGFELDIVVTKDKKLIISHDMFIKDSLGKNHYIHTLSYNDLLTLSAKVNNDLTLEGEPYPLLEDVLTLYEKQFNKKTLLLEIKSLPALEILPLTYFELIKTLLLQIEAYKILNQCYIISFDYRLLEEIKKQNEKTKVGLILHRNLVPLRCLLNDISLDLLIMEREWITKEQVIQAKKYNVEIFAWTSNIQTEWMRLSSLGVKGLITDRPKILEIHKKNNIL